MVIAVQPQPLITPPLHTAEEADIKGLTLAVWIHIPLSTELMLVSDALPLQGLRLVARRQRCGRSHYPCQHRGKR